PLRESPDALTGLFTTRNQLLSQLVVVRKEAGRFRSEGYHARARERGVVEDMVRFLLRGVMQRVGKDDAPLGVGVDDLDCLARHGPDDVARLVGAPAGEV